MGLVIPARLAALADVFGRKTRPWQSSSASLKIGVSYRVFLKSGARCDVRIGHRIETLQLVAVMKLRAGVGVWGKWSGWGGFPFLFFVVRFNYGFAVYVCFVGWCVVGEMGIFSVTSCDCTIKKKKLEVRHILTKKHLCEPEFSLDLEWRFKVQRKSFRFFEGRQIFWTEIFSGSRICVYFNYRSPNKREIKFYCGASTIFSKKFESWPSS